MAELYYFHDPMCSWCWGFRPAAECLFATLPANVIRINVLGGLAPDRETPMPAAQRDIIRSHWQRIEASLGTEFNYDFWTRCTPRRSTYPACRAVIAAAKQDREEAMIVAIQEAYYLGAKNPSDTSTHIDLAARQGLDVEQFRSDLDASATNQELQRQIGFSRRRGVMSFPTLLLNINGVYQSIDVNYSDHSAMLEQISAALARPSPGTGE